jgi:hypothetical protein
MSQSGSHRLDRLPKIAASIKILNGLYDDVERRTTRCFPIQMM